MDDGYTRDRVVALTGASGGVGRAVVRELAKHAGSVALLARGEIGLAAAADEVRGAGATPMMVPVDVADAAQIEAAVARIEDELGPIDIWVNSAFTSVFAPFAEIRPEEFKRVTDVTYLGAVYATMTVLRRMRERDAGTIVQVVGASTTATLIMNALAPGLLDRYLARTGFKAQQTGRPKDPDQLANLWEPADGGDGRDFGAHGAFDQRAKPRSVQVFASQHHKALLGVGAAAVAGLSAAAGRKARAS